MNKVFLVGTMCAEPKMYRKGESVVAKFSLAINEFNKQGDNTTQFISCAAFGKKAELVEKYIHKGYTFPLVGKIQTSVYTNKDGKKVYTTDIVVEELNFISNKNNEKPKEESNGDGFISYTNSQVPVWMSEC